ncbi:MAG TPA: SUMF1/EgtB/PvdO family nonheme iron enzyme [Thermotogota bacterium]|nr:SUMF1/EgtB/PvdO family nonheme iron enzyme [Thermotogota bacterium]
MEQDYFIPRVEKGALSLPFNVVQGVLESVTDRQTKSFSQKVFHDSIESLRHSFSLTARMLFFPTQAIFPFGSRRIILTHDFWLGKFPVSFYEFDQFCKQVDHPLPNDNGEGRAFQTVTNVSWLDAVAFCNWLSDVQGMHRAYSADGFFVDVQGNRTTDLSQVEGYRLPTVAEWQFAIMKGYKVRRGLPRGASGDFPPDNDLDLGNKFLCYMQQGAWEWCHDRYNETMEDEAFDFQSLQKNNLWDPVGRKAGTFHSVVRLPQSPGGEKWLEESTRHEGEVSSVHGRAYFHEKLTFRLARSMLAKQADQAGEG